MRILGYSYDASIMCPDCAGIDHNDGRLIRTGNNRKVDEHGLPVDLEDRHGNPVRPVFSTDEGATDETCGACFNSL